LVIGDLRLAIGDWGFYGQALYFPNCLPDARDGVKPSHHSQFTIQNFPSVSTNCFIFKYIRLFIQDFK